MKEIPLTRGMVALVDDEDYAWLMQWRWRLLPSKNNCFYATTSVPSGGKNKSISMHRMILKTPKGMLTDHIDGNGLNNQRSNLRACTSLQNSRNKARESSATYAYKGIQPVGNKWRARLFVPGKKHHIGVYATPEEAARAYDKAAIQEFGEFARLNFPQD
jgi:hypothetical protein